MLQVQFPRISNLSYFFGADYVYFRSEFLDIMTKKECKDGECRVDIPDLSVEDDTEKKVDKKDSSKRLR